MEKYNILKTSPGINVRGIIMIIGGCLILLFIWLSQLPKKVDDSSPGTYFFLFMILNVIVLGVIAVLIFPNSKTIEFNKAKNQIRILFNRKKSELIDVENIKRITLIRKFVNSFFSEITFYRLEYSDNNGDLKKVCFRIAGKESKSFVNELKKVK